jgi:hypothetical protein
MAMDRPMDDAGFTRAQRAHLRLALAKLVAGSDTLTEGGGSWWQAGSAIGADDVWLDERPGDATEDRPSQAPEQGPPVA